MNENEVAYYKSKREENNAYPRLPLFIKDVEESRVQQVLNEMTGLQKSQIMGFKGRVFNYELAKSKMK